MRKKNIMRAMFSRKSAENLRSWVFLIYDLWMKILVVGHTGLQNEVASIA